MEIRFVSNAQRYIKRLNIDPSSYFGRLEVDDLVLIFVMGVLYLYLMGKLFFFN